MTLESMIFPIPSELVMPFVGFLIAQGKLSLILAILVSSVGTLFGSLLSYGIGRKYGRTFVTKWGKFFLLDEKHLAWTEKYFQKSGEKTIFISRFIPIVRHLISIPAGIGKMNLAKFSLYTIIGGTLWNVFLLYLGYKLAEKWEIIHTYSSKIDFILAIIIVIALIFYLYKIFQHRKLKNI